MEANMLSGAGGKYRSAFWLALWVSILLVAEAVTHALSALFNACQILLLEVAASGMSIPYAVAEAQDARQRLLAAIAIGVGLAAAILTLVWVYRANRNARSLGSRRHAIHARLERRLVLCACGGAFHGLLHRQGNLEGQQAKQGGRLA